MPYQRKPYTATNLRRTLPVIGAALRALELQGDEENTKKLFEAYNIILNICKIYSTNHFYETPNKTPDTKLAIRDEVSPARKRELEINTLLYHAKLALRDENNLDKCNKLIAEAFSDAVCGQVSEEFRASMEDRYYKLVKMANI